MLCRFPPIFAHRGCTKYASKPQPDLPCRLFSTLLVVLRTVSSLACTSKETAPLRLRLNKSSELDGALLVRAADRVLPAVVASTTLRLTHDALGALLGEPGRAHLPEVAGSWTEPRSVGKRKMHSQIALPHTLAGDTRTAAAEYNTGSAGPPAGQTHDQGDDNPFWALGCGGNYKARPGGSGTCGCPSAGRCGR